MGSHVLCGEKVAILLSKMLLLWGLMQVYHNQALFHAGSVALLPHQNVPFRGGWQRVQGRAYGVQLHTKMFLQRKKRGFPLSGGSAIS